MPELNEVQFAYTHDNGYGTRELAAHVDDEHVGQMYLRPRPDGSHEVSGVEVHPEMQRQGIGTGMWHEAERRGLKPAHSEDRTEAGDAWARKIGGHLPPREESDDFTGFWH